VVQEPTPISQPPARVCKSCGCNSPLPARARLNMVYCSARCRAFEWSRANRDFSTRITVADFENVREAVKRVEARLNRVVVGYELIGRHPIAKVAGQIGESTFPPKDRKTKRMADESGRTRVRDTPYYSFSEWFEAPRVPVKGTYVLRAWYEGQTRPHETGVEVVVKKAFPAVHFYDEKTGQRYTLKGEGIPPKAPKPPKSPTERRKRKPPAAIGPQPEREPSTERVSELVPAVVAQRAPDAELVELSKKFEDERQRFTKERTDLLATLSREQTLRRDLEQKLLRATSVSKVPARDDGSSRLQAAENRALDAQIKELRQSLSQLQGRVTEVEKDKASLTRERDALTKERDELKVKVAEQQVGNATLARQIITLERAKAAERERTELVERPRDAEPDQAAPAASAAPAATAAPAAPAAPAAKADAATPDAGAASTPPSSPTGIVIHRLAFGGNLPPASSPKSGPPNLGILGQSQRPPIRGSANKKHKRR